MGNESKLTTKSTDVFASRHLGLSDSEISELLNELGFKTLTDFISKVIPQQIQVSNSLRLSTFQEPMSEAECLAYFQSLAKKNIIAKNYIGCGYYDTVVPAVIQRNILENPSWYTQYTPYQPEISQGRLEALLNFQTMIMSLTGLEISNASLLDEGTAAAEAMYMSFNLYGKNNPNIRKYFVDQNVFPQTLAVIQTRATSLGLELVVGDYQKFTEFKEVFGCYIQYPASHGGVIDYRKFIATAKNAGCYVTVGTDLLALCLLESPGSMGADIAVGSAQRFGVPMGFGGPHAGFMACKTEFQRLIPGRLIGVSKDRLGNPALRLSLQTREQHIRRDKATSNICTAQVLLAIMAVMYATYHGPAGLKAIATRVHRLTKTLAKVLADNGIAIKQKEFFDTLEIEANAEVIARANAVNINLGVWKSGSIVIAIDETTSASDLQQIIKVITKKEITLDEIERIFALEKVNLELSRKSEYLKESVFNTYHTETEFLRYAKRLETKDLSLATAMIPLGSCTMKLNATTEMLPVTMPEFSKIHPFAPESQTVGYLELINTLEKSLEEITGFDCVSLQPNAGSQGEFAGLIAIKAYLNSRGESHRDICLIPKSAHGTNPASAVIAGLKVIVIECDQDGNVDLADLEAKAKLHQANLAALMVTYPSTHGVFEEDIKIICDLIHKNGGQVYLDGANFNALVGLSYPAEIGADVMHINLHKTFCIPHGGGGPGVGPIAAKEHLRNYLPSHPLAFSNDGFGPVSAAPYGSASILSISLAYIAMMGAEGLVKASQVAILSANYLANKLGEFYPVLYRGKNKLVAHECILDCRSFKDVGVEVEDIAKRLMDYGFHAPTVSWPVPGTIMVEPTESEGLAELNRFCEAMIGISKEIADIKSGELDRADNPLKSAPHIAIEVCGNVWNHSYSRELAAYPTNFVKNYKFWPTVARIDAAYGDRNLVCSCSA